MWLLIFFLLLSNFKLSLVLKPFPVLINVFSLKVYHFLDSITTKQGNVSYEIWELAVY